MLVVRLLQRQRQLIHASGRERLALQSMVRLASSTKAPQPSLGEQYERLSSHDHVLRRPEMYLGQIEPSTIDTWVLDEELMLMRKKSIKYSPALNKIFDEILVNAADNMQRDEKMSSIEVTVDLTASTKDKTNKLRISIYNDGKGIPIEIHPKENILIPELLFGCLLTGSNFDDSQNRMVGGRHGYGAKLTNIFSKSFEVETYDAEKKKLYKQKWRKNMKSTDGPKIKEGVVHPNSYTRVTFEPDLPRFGLAATDSAVLTDTVSLLKRRVYDIAACVGPSVRVSYNGGQVGLDCFADYVKLFAAPPGSSSSSSGNSGSSSIVSSSSSTSSSSNNSTSSSSSIINISSTDVDPEPIFYTKVNDRWEVAVKRSTTGAFEQMAFVNTVWTSRGGSHVNLVTSQITKAIEASMAKKKGNSQPVASAALKNKMMVFVKCNVENASFDSQSKETLSSSPESFGSECVLTDSFLSTVVKDSGIVADLLLDLWYREAQKLRRATTSRGPGTQVVEVPKLEDAHHAGHSSKAAGCTLILTEGDSAKALAVAGLEVVGRESYGVLPLRGKILNVRVASTAQLSRNAELINLCKAMGLDFTKDYAQGVEGLRYGSVMLMCDQDNDGSHIKGLVINFFQKFWPNLLKIDGFLQQFITPLVKLRDPSLKPLPVVGAGAAAASAAGKKGKKGKASLGNAASLNDPSVRSFYSTQEYDHYRTNNLTPPDTKKPAQVKYYKGLGTNTAEEGKSYFRALAVHKKEFREGGSAHEPVDMAFSGKRVADRKVWLNTYDPTSYIDPKLPTLTYKDFVGKELIHFSYADNNRSIPSAIDGLKPSQRKVLFGCFKRKLETEMKVVQLAGYIAEKTSYHHGEASLHATIIHMAQDFVGSNNVPLLEAAGQFGTRAAGGKDFASPRYIFTRPMPVARALFPEADDTLLDYLEEDGLRVEPRYFIPVVPTLLLNGSKGIGTGWSTTVPTYNPGHVIDHLTSRIRGMTPSQPLAPWIRGFTGTIEPSEGKYYTTGVIERTDQTTIKISELPYGRWTAQYKNYLCKKCADGTIKRIAEHHTTNSVLFIVTGLAENLDQMASARGGLVASFRLRTPIATKNMHAFNRHGRIVNYARPEDIIEEHFPVRMEAYQRRKENLARKYAAEEALSRNRSQFVMDILSGELSILPGSGGVGGGGRVGALSEGEVAAELRKRQFATSHQIREIGGPLGLPSGLGGRGSLMDDDDDDDDTALSVPPTPSSTSTSDTATTTTTTPYDRAAYSYLLDMPLRSLTDERAAALRRDAERAQERLRAVQAQTPEDMWLAELDALGTVCADLLR